MLISELRISRFFDVFEYNGPLNLWGCFLCNHPDRARGFLQDTQPVIEVTISLKYINWSFHNLSTILKKKNTLNHSFCIFADNH